MISCTELVSCLRSSSLCQQQQRPTSVARFDFMCQQQQQRPRCVTQRRLCTKSRMVRLPTQRNPMHQESKRQCRIRIKRNPVVSPCTLYCPACDHASPDHACPNTVQRIGLHTCPSRMVWLPTRQCRSPVRFRRLLL